MATVTIDNYKAASETLRSPELRQALYDEGAVLMDKVLVNLHGDEHRTRRRVESKIFRRDFFRWYETDVFPKTLKQTLDPYLAAAKTDLIDFGYHVMVNLTADFAGVDRPEHSPEETERMLQMMRTFGKAATLGQAKGDKAAIREEIRQALADFDEEFYQPSKKRREALIERFKAGEIEEDELPRDIFVELLRSQDEVPLPPDVLMKEIAFFLLAGAFTSIHTMSHTMHDIMAWRDAHPEDRDAMENDMLFLQRCVHEAMRLHPSSPTAGRRATSPVHLPGGHDAGEGDYVNIDLMAANRDTSVFGPDAADYNPHREVPKNMGLYGLSFGMGMHSCIGINLAAGALPRPDIDPATHQYGIVTLIARALLDHNVRPDPDDPAVQDTSTVRHHWAKYPVLLG